MPRDENSREIAGFMQVAATAAPGHRLGALEAVISEEIDRLAAEGPTPDWALPLPEPVSGAPVGLQRYAFALDGLPPGASAQGARLTLTLVAGSKAIEVTAPLD